MRKIIDIRLMPEVVKAIKNAQDDCGIILYNCNWQYEAIGDMDKTEECYSIGSFQSANLFTTENPNESAAKNLDEQSE